MVFEGPRTSAPQRRAAFFGGVGAPVPIRSPVFHHPSADMEPIIGPGEDSPHAIPPVGDAPLHRIPVESVLGLIFLIFVRFFTGEAFRIQRNPLTPRAPGLAGRHEKKPGIALNFVGVDD